MPYKNCDHKPCEFEMLPICAYPLTVHEEVLFKAFYKTFYNYDWHSVEIYIYPKCGSVFGKVNDDDEQ